MVSGKGKGKVTDDEGNGKRKWSGGDDKTGQKLKHSGALQFFDDEAYGVEEEDEDSSGADTDFVSESEDERGPGEAFYVHEVKDEAMSEDEFDRLMADRYKPGSGLVTYAEDGHDHENSIDRDIYVPSAKDATIWKVKCAVGRERHSIFCLMHKHVDLVSLRNKLPIISACALDHVKGFIIIEAEKPQDIYKACKGLSTIHPYYVTAVPRNEISQLLSIRSKSNAISEDKDDLGQSLQQTPYQAQVQLDKRVEYLEKGNEAIRKELEEFRSFRTTLQESMAELTRMVCTMVKEKGVSVSASHTTGPEATTLEDSKKFSAGGGSTGSAQTTNANNNFHTVGLGVPPGFGSRQKGSEQVFVENIVGHHATTTGYMGSRDTMPALHTYFSAAHHLSHNTFANPYLTTGFGGPWGGTHGPGLVMQMGQPLIVNAGAAAASHSLPMFGGGNPESWISRIEQYFYLHGISEASKLDVALIAMEGNALYWFQWKRASTLGLTWNQFKLELLKMFGSNPLANPIEALVHTKQTGTVDEYVTTFITRLVHVPGLDESYCLGLFLSGLKADIRLKIRSCDVRTLSETIHLARKIEHEVEGLSETEQITAPVSTRVLPPWANFLPRNSENTYLNQGQQTAGGENVMSLMPPLRDTRGSPTSNTRSSMGSASLVSQSRSTRLISHKDYLAKRAAGKCFRCDEKWSPTHRCSDKTLQVIIISEPDDTELEESVTPSDGRGGSHMPASGFQP